MQLKVLGSSSAGNGYILEAKEEALIIEAGIPVSEYKKALDFNLLKVKGTLVSHSHGDHSKYVAQFVKSGLDVFTSNETVQELKFTHHRLHSIDESKSFRIGAFLIKTYEVKHDVKCLCFLINHPECGNVLFVTDTYYIPYTFRNLNNIIIEANFDQAIIDEKLSGEKMFRRNRVMHAHLSKDHCLRFLQANDLSKVNNIVLVHLSDGNSNENDFVNEVAAFTGKGVYAATPGLIIDFNNTPF